ncbi:MAG: hypothetical protein SOY83_04615, partial [Anaerovoracaceae bacterium]|nr:hypothetical protein [Anaerovoracaceae bacterium]
MSRSKAKTCRNEIKSYITREGMTMTEVVGCWPTNTAGAAASPTFPASCGEAPCGTPKPLSWPMCWATIWSGRSAGRQCNFTRFACSHIRAPDTVEI